MARARSSATRTSIIGAHIERWGHCTKGSTLVSNPWLRPALNFLIVQYQLESSVTGQAFKTMSRANHSPYRMVCRLSGSWPEETSFEEVGRICIDKSASGKFTCGGERLTDS